MQNKGIIKVFAILFGLVSLYQLSFTFIAGSAETDAEEFAKQRVSQLAENYASKMDNVEQQYLDSIADDPIFAGITYGTAKEKELNQGLDLKGGINVILEISVKDILRELSNNSKNPAFNKALNRADEMQKDSQDDYASLFFEAFNEIPDAQLASPSIFANKKMSGSIEYDMSNSEVQNVLRKKIDASIGSAFEVLRKRIDRFGVTQPNIQRLGESGRILVELPGAKNIDRIKNLLQTTAELQFWYVYNAQQLQNFFVQADQRVKELKGGADAQPSSETEETQSETAMDSTATEQDTAAADDQDIDALLDNAETDKSKKEQAASQNPLLSKMTQGRGGVLGTVAVSDTAEIGAYLRMPQIQSLLPAQLKYAKFEWGLVDDETNRAPLYALQSNRQGKPPLSGDVITDANQSYGQMGSVTVNMQMNGPGSKAWEQMTEKAANENLQIAIVLDNIVYSAPGVDEPIAGGRSRISGDFDTKEGKDLANVLKAGKLPAKAFIVQSEIVGPSLGQEAVDSGILSFVIAMIFVLVWMFFYYGKAGLFADVALAVNILFIFGILSGLGAVLTLPGIAGIVLTIGMSVDANVLIFERIREELDKGKMQAEAIRDGFKNALSSILDANITTFLTGLILFIFGTGPIRGFATTLLIGIITSLFTAIFITRLFIDGYGKNGKSIIFSSGITKNWFKKVNIAFVQKRKVAYVVSGILVVISVISLFVNGLNQGVDFVGGRTYTVRFDKPVDATKVEDNLIEVFGSAEAKTYGSDDQLKITTKYKIDEEGAEIDDEVSQKLYQAVQPYLPQNTSYDDFRRVESGKTIGMLSSIKVGPTIADDIKTASFYAVIGALIIVFLYILLRFSKWQFSLGAVVAVFHDVLIILGLFSLLYGVLPFSMEINQAFIAAILTVVGYSLNDTVVVFDRIREYFKEHSSWPFADIIHKALNSTVSRTVNTSFTTLIVLLTIFIFGGESIRGFMFALIVGVIVGTYSSLFIATPIMFETAKKSDALKRMKEADDRKKKKAEDAKTNKQTT
jgi:SecD/SecF fusion protein